MTLSIENGGYAFLRRLDLMFFMSLWKEFQLLHGGNIHVIFWTCACLIKCLHAFRWRELDILSENVVKVRAYYMF